MMRPLTSTDSEVVQALLRTFKLAEIIRDIPVSLSLHCGNAVIGRVANYLHQLGPAEQGQISNAVVKRQMEFSSGRHFARLALEHIGRQAASISSDSRRRPQWPAGITGSISHTDELAISIVLPRTHIDSIGIDAEHHGRLSKDLYRLILTNSESAHIEQLGTLVAGQDPATLIFSAKEAIFKATNPITNHMIDFREVTVTVDPYRQRFKASYIGHNAENNVMNAGCGSYFLAEGHYFTLFAIPN